MNEIVENSRILLETGTNELEILEFFLEIDSEFEKKTEPTYFGVNVAKVMEVIESPELIPSENAQHPCYLGVIPLRDLVLPVLDIGNWLGLQRRKTDSEIVIVTEFSQNVTGFLVSGVTDIYRVGWEDVLSPDRYIARFGTCPIIGTVNKGGHFIQLLDFETVIADLNPEFAEETWRTTVKAPKEYKAIVADDSPTIRLMLKKNLESANFKPTLVNNGSEALKLIQILKKKAHEQNLSITDFVDIIISDIEMPQMDGFTLTKRIKNDKDISQLPVILYSSIITKELKHKGESVGADDQIAKPELNKMAERAIKILEQKG